ITVGGLFASADHPDNPGAADTGEHLIAAENLQFFGHDARGAVDIEQQFRMRMKIATPGGDLRLQTSDTVGNRHGQLLESVRPLRAASWVNRTARAAQRIDQWP